MGETAGLERLSAPSNAFERFLGAAKLFELDRTVGLEMRRHFSQAALLAEYYRSLESCERVAGPAQGVLDDRSVALHRGGVPSRAILDVEGERALHLRDALRVSEPRARVAVIAERPRRLRQSELCCKQPRTVCGRDRLPG